MRMMMMMNSVWTCVGQDNQSHKHQKRILSAKVWEPVLVTMTPEERI